MLRQYRWTWVWVNQGRTLPGERVHVTTLPWWRTPDVGLWGDDHGW